MNAARTVAWATVDDPNWIRDRYLQVPAALPERVRALAATIAGDADNRFDAASRIETFLRRTYPYTDAIDGPPPARDRVDWFLFDERQGYCDYFSSAFVVLARLAGIPARLAAGYSLGTYVIYPDQFEVKDLHVGKKLRTSLFAGAHQPERPRAFPRKMLGRHGCRCPSPEGSDLGRIHHRQWKAVTGVAVDQDRHHRGQASCGIHGMRIDPFGARSVRHARWHRSEVSIPGLEIGLRGHFQHCLTAGPEGALHRLDDFAHAQQLLYFIRADDQSASHVARRHISLPS